MLDSLPRLGPWPLKLKEKQGLRKNRGEVFRLGEAAYAVVGFDGRNEGYLCWQADVDGVFDTSQLVKVDIFKAHNAVREVLLEELVPTEEMPALDHTGRPCTNNEGRGSAQRRRPSPATKELSSRRQGTGSMTAQPSEPPSSTSDSVHTRDVPRPAAVQLDLRSVDATPPWSNFASGLHSGSETPWCEPLALNQDGLLVDAGTAEGKAMEPPAEALKPCVVCALLKLLTSTVCLTLGSLQATLRFWARARCGVALPTLQTDQEWTIGQDGAWCMVPNSHKQGADDEVEGISAASGSKSAGVRTLAALDKGDTATLSNQANCMILPSNQRRNPRKQHSARQSPLSRQRSGCEELRKDGFEDLQIVIPIVKPPSWQEVQPLVHRMPVTFDERGVKETMTVKPARWASFVDRQKTKLEKEIHALKTAPELVLDEMRTQQVDDDVAELEQLIESMEDWKDLSRYAGKSISMASTRRGNEMKIHVMAFAEREDFQGIDFMRLSYKKSVEVRPQRKGTDDEQSVLRNVKLGLRGLLPFLPPVEGTPEAEERWVRLLQRPDVAKFTIALAFREALEDDGVLLQFSEARLED